MEWSLHIARAADLEGDLTVGEHGQARTPVPQAAAKQICEAFGDVRFDRCAFGSEFCEHLIPAVEPLREAYAAARSRGLEFTLLTPYVSDAGIRKLRPLFERLNELGGCEVSFNDWGVLNVLRREFPALTPVQGRLLNKSLRDPRVMGIYGESQAVSGAAAMTLRALQRSNLDCGSYVTLLARFGVNAVEMDLLPQGTHFELPASVAVFVYLPFGFIATSRSCMAAGLHCRKADKFQPGAPCRHECQTHLLEYTYTNSPFGNRDQKFWMKGNTYFYTHTASMIEQAVEHARAGRISRFIFQPSLPMLWPS